MLFLSLNYSGLRRLLLESGCMFVFEDVIARFESACRWNGAAFSQEDAWRRYAHDFRRFSDLTFCVRIFNRSVWTVLRKLQPELLLAFTSITQDVGGSCTCYEFVSFVWGTCGLAPSPAKAAEVFQQCCVDLCQDTPFLLGAPVAVGELNVTRPPQMMGFIKVSELTVFYFVRFRVGRLRSNRAVCRGRFEVVRIVQRFRGRGCKPGIGKMLSRWKFAMP